MSLISVGTRQCVKLSDEEIKNVLAIQKRLTDKIGAYQKEISLLEQNLGILKRLVSESSYTSAANMMEGQEQQQQGGGEEEEPNLRRDMPEAGAAAQGADAAGAYDGDGDGGREDGGEEKEEPSAYIRDSRTDRILAGVHRTDDSINIIIARGVDGGAELTQETEPFESFFIQKILGGMRKKDDEGVQGGTLAQSDAISYEVGTDPDTGSITNILVRNYRDERRASEIINTAGWSFSRMLESMEVQGS